MKKLRFFTLLALVSVLAPRVWAAPTYDGSDGYITMPSVDVPDRGRLGLSLKYTSESTLTPSLNIVPLKGWEIGAGWDIDFDAGFMNPLLLSTKFQFVKQAAIGFKAELGLETFHNNFFTLYLAWVEQLKAGGVADSTATFSFGYTFGQWSNINFFLGFQRNIFIPKLYLIGDISNFPYRYQGSGSHLSAFRGIVNLGLRLILTPSFSLDLAGMDLMDANRRIQLGGNLYLGLWK